MAGSSDIKAGGVFVEIYTKDGKFRSGLDMAAAKFKSFGKTVMAAGAGIYGLGTAIGLGMYVMAKKAAEGGASLLEMSERTGMSVESLSAFKLAVAQSGLEMEDFETAIKKMQKAANGDDAAKMFAKVGVSLADFEKMSVDQQLITMAAALDKIEDPGKRAAKSMDVFGKAGTKMLNVLGGGAEGVNKKLDLARQLGLDSTTKGAEAAKEMNDQMIALEMITKKAAGIIGSALIPALISMNNMDLKSHSNWLKVLKDNKALIVVAAMAAGGLVILGGVVAATGAALWTFGSILSAISATIGGVVAAVKILSTAFMAIAAFAAANPFVLLTAGIIALGVYLVATGPKTKTAAGLIGDSFRGAKDDVISSLKGIEAALAKGDLVAAAKIGMLLIQVEWNRMIGEMKSRWFDLVADLKIAWAGWVADAATGITNIAAQMAGIPGAIGAKFQAFTDQAARRLIDLQERLGLISKEEAAIARKDLGTQRVQHQLDREKAVNANERERANKAGAIIDQRDRNQINAMAERDGKVQALNDELQKLRDQLAKANDPANFKGPLDKLPFGSPFFGGDPFAGQKRAFGNGSDVMGKIGAAGTFDKQLLGQLFGPGGPAVPANPQVKATEKVEKEVAKVHAVNIKMLGALGQIVNQGRTEPNARMLFGQ